MEYQKRRGFSTAKGEDYEVALCSLIILRALRLASDSDFFLASNHDLAGDFDDVVLFYRLQGDQPDEYRAILLQAKHKDRITQKKLTSSNPFSLKDYLKSFKEIRQHWEHTLKVGDVKIQLQEITLVLYTNTGCVIGEAAVDVTNFPQVRHLQEFLNTRGGRLLRISEGQRLGLPEGDETSDFLSLLLLCTGQMSVGTANSILEEEICKFFKLTSPEVARKLNTELKRAVKDWWSEEGTVRYLTAECEEWKKVLQMQITRLNGDTVNIDRQLKVEFTDAAVELSDVVPPSELRWIRVRDDHQAKAVRSRLFRAQKNSLVISVNPLDDHLKELEAVWRNKICPTLVLDMSTASPEDGTPMLQRLPEAVQSGAGRRLVVIAKGNPTSGGWSQVDPEPTWSVLHQVTRDRLLEAPVRLQGEAVALRDVIGCSHVSDVMTDEVISSVCECETAMELGAAMSAPLEYNLPRCLQRTSARTVNLDTLANTKILICSSNYFVHGIEFTKRFNIISKYEADRMTAVKYPAIVQGLSYDYDIRQMCFRLGVRGIFGEISMEGLQGNVKEFFPFTWICEDKIVVIEGPPGVGKSSFVTATSSSVKEQFPETWVLRLDMGRHTDYIKDTDFTIISHIKELLLKGLSREPNNLERQLLEHSLTVTGNVFLFLDAFDEISPDFTGKCCDLLKGIAQMIRYRQMVVTTRPVTTKDVEEALQTKAFTLPVFSEEEQDIFLRQFSAAKGKPVGEEEISSLRQSAGPVLEIPLLCRMAAEVLLSRREQLLFKSQDPWRRVLLYQLFVEQSVKERVAEKLELDISRPGLKTLLESNQKQHLQNLQGLAVRKLMPTAQLPPLSFSTATPEEKLGLVVNTGGRVDFEHQTFAEYFLGCWLACHWENCPRQLLRVVLFQGDLQFVAATLSWSLFDGFHLHLAVARGDEDLVRKHLSPRTTDRGGRSALHVAAMTKNIPRKVWELLMTSDLNRKDGVLGATAVKYAELFSNWDFVELGMENLANITDLKLVTMQEAAKEVLIHAVKSDLGCLCRFICRRHPYIFQDLPLLHLAAANNSIHTVKLLIGKRFNLNALNKFQLTPLHEASRSGHVESVALLVNSGANLNTQTQYGHTALTLAADGGHLEVVKILLEKGARLNVKTENGKTALTMAARGGHLDVGKLLLSKGARCNWALAEAAGRRHLDVVKLLEKGAHLNRKTVFAETALMEASRGGHLEVVKLLLETGSHLNVKNVFGETPLTEAAREGHLDVVKMLLENGAAGVSMALTNAAHGGHLEVLKLLLEKGARLNVKNKDGETSLMAAARRGHLEALEVLLENGAAVNMKNVFGDTVLMQAASRGDVDAVKILLEKGADLSTKNVLGGTALTGAALSGNLDLVKILLEKRAELNIKTENGNMALMEAARGDHLEVVKVLLEEESDLNIKTASISKALTKAALEGHLEVVKVLLEKGPALNVKNSLGNTALMEAASRGHLEVVRILSEKGADVNAKNVKGETALMLAGEGRHREVFEFLSRMEFRDV